ncbi:hypothetical protein [Halomontanus rarus]|nr:hypothetical protein [Halovivax sp. TS33]
MAYTEGTVSEVHFLDGDEPDIVTVDLDNGDRLYLDLIINKRGLVEERNI